MSKSDTETETKTETKTDAKTDAYRARSLQCELQAAKADDVKSRAGYEELARAWANLAENVEARMQIGHRPPPQDA